MFKFLKKAFSDMKRSAKAQHEEAKAMNHADTREALMQKKRNEQIAAASKRRADAKARIDAAKGNKDE